VEAYRAALDSAIERAYSVALVARQEGFDPEVTPEIPRAQDMASRVEKLLAHLRIEGISEEIRALARDMPREELAVTVARRLATDPRRPGTLADRVDAALRVGLAILTEGILVAPLEGLAEVHLVDGPEGPFIELYYAGPIRAAGGTAQALSVLLADIIRRDLHLAAYRAEPGEVGRYQEEIPLYKRYQHLQYTPSAEEIALVVRNVPVCISGEATEGDAEISAFRNLPRVPTNGIRGGACLVIAEGLCQKASKIGGIVDKLGIPGWEFLDNVGHASASEDETTVAKYLADAGVGGRPILAHPNRPGGFRLVYGRGRTTGLAACAVNPATMVVLHHFIAVGTQLKLEYPGKAAAMSVCDLVEGPIVELADGTLTSVHDPDRAQALLPEIRRIVDIGEILISYGEFLENNRPLAPGAYTLDWHEEEARALGAPWNEVSDPRNFSEARAVAQRFGLPLHPRWLLFWHDLTSSEIRTLAEYVERFGSWREGRLELPWDAQWRELLVRLGFLHHREPENRLVGEPTSSEALVGTLGLEPDGALLVRTVPLDADASVDPLDYVSRLAGVRIMARGPSRIGARVGRPEKAHHRSMEPNVHGLFPVGESGGPSRSVSEAVRRTMADGEVSITLGVRSCSKCHRNAVWCRCQCGGHTEPTGEMITRPFPIATIWGEAMNRLHLPRLPQVKGVKGLTSRTRTPEPVEKAILRAAHAVSVYQDGTARFDLMDLPITHFRAREIGVDVSRLRSLGYETDWTGAPLTDLDQLVEIMPQDLIVARACGDYLLRIAQFLDDELVHLYGLDPFYRAQSPEDLVGCLVAALAPHTSGAVAGRIIGFTKAEACFAHPIFHAAKRRNCDGDEDSLTLLLDALLNFSRAYLPDSRGALMDKPLVLTTRLDATEVDKEAQHVDVGLRYPLEFYRAASQRRAAKEVESLLDTVGRRIDHGSPLHFYGFTHDTTDIARGPVRSAYRDGRTMDGMVDESVTLMTQIRAVDSAEAIGAMLTTHFLPDVMGNLKSFATQKFRCKTCGTNYRRPPLSGRCTGTSRGNARCDGALLPTVYEGMVRKYLTLCERLGSMDGVPPYVRQRVEVLVQSLSTLFPASASQTTLDSFLAPATAGAAPP
jgi:DNA polymerase II large subunit